MKRKIMIGVLAILVILLAVIGVLLFQKSRRIDEYTAQLSLGDKYLEELDYENAEIAYKRAIEIDEKRAPAYVNLSVVYVKQNRFEEAKALLEEAAQKVSQDQAREEIQKQLQTVEQEEEKYQEEQEEETASDNEEALSIQTGVYLSQDNLEDTLTIEEIREGNTVVFTVFWYRTATMDQAEAQIADNAGAFSYYSDITGYSAEGTLEFQGNNTVVLNLNQSTLPYAELGSTTFVMQTPEEEAADKAAQAEEIRQWLTQGSGRWYKDDPLDETGAANFSFQQDGTAVYWPKTEEYVNTTSYTLDGDQITITFLALDTLEPVPLTYQVRCLSSDTQKKIQLNLVSTEADTSKLYGFDQLVPGWYTLEP